MISIIVPYLLIFYIKSSKSKPIRKTNQYHEYSIVISFQKIIIILHNQKQEIERKIQEQWIRIKSFQSKPSTLQKVGPAFRASSSSKLISLFSRHLVPAPFIQINQSNNHHKSHRSLMMKSGACIHRKNMRSSKPW